MFLIFEKFHLILFFLMISNTLNAKQSTLVQRVFSKGRASVINLTETFDTFRIIQLYKIVFENSFKYWLCQKL